MSGNHHNACGECGNRINVRLEYDRRFIDKHVPEDATPNPAEREDKCAHKIQRNQKWAGEVVAAKQESTHSFNHSVDKCALALKTRLIWYCVHTTKQRNIADGPGYKCYSLPL